jgi:hypothetical protein
MVLILGSTRQLSPRFTRPQRRNEAIAFDHSLLLRQFCELLLNRADNQICYLLSIDVPAQTLFAQFLRSRSSYHGSMFPRGMYSL